LKKTKAQDTLRFPKVSENLLTYKVGVDA